MPIYEGINGFTNDEEISCDDSKRVWVFLQTYRNYMSERKGLIKFVGIGIV